VVMKAQKLPGIACWFPFHDYELIQETCTIIKELKIEEVRTAFSWADWERPGGQEWFDYMVGQLHSQGVMLVPCLFYTPLHLAMHKKGSKPQTSFPPNNLEDFSVFTAKMIDRYGYVFEWIQLWNEANWQVYWDQELDPEGKLFAQMVKQAIPICHHANKKIVLGGLSPYDPAWVKRMFDYGVMQNVQALGIHAFPRTWVGPDQTRRPRGKPWISLEAEVQDARNQLKELGLNTEVWITETGHSTWGQGQEREQNNQVQIEFFKEVLSTSADKVFWYTVFDLKYQAENDNTLNNKMEFDEKLYNFGLATVYRNKKPLFHYWRRLADSFNNRKLLIS